ncbi:MAG: FecR domain-containing protein [Leptospira sp.]|nr:FecR domain-containing protein [Leptospira sp.]
MNNREDTDKIEEQISRALTGESNEYSAILSQLKNKLQSAFSIPEEQSNVIVNFEMIWNKHLQNEKLSSQSQSFGANTQQEVLPLYKRSWVRGLVSIAAIGLITWVGWFSYQELSKPILPSYDAKITNVYGRAYLLNSDGSPRVDLKNLDRISAGETVMVESNSFVDFAITPNSSIRIRSNTTLNFEILVQEELKDRIVLYLKEGSVLTKVSKLKKFSEFTIRTEMGNVQVRGTRFVTETKNDTLKVGVVSGKVNFTKDSASGVSILPGFEVESSASGITQKPISKDLEKQLAELDSVLMQEPDNMVNIIQSEDDLFRLYSIIEQIHLENGNSVRGVVFGMNDGNLLIRTVSGEMKIPQDKILDVEKIR